MMEFAVVIAIGREWSQLLVLLARASVSPFRLLSICPIWPPSSFLVTMMAEFSEAFRLASRMPLSPSSDLRAAGKAHTVESSLLYKLLGDGCIDGKETGYERHLDSKGSWY